MLAETEPKKNLYDGIKNKRLLELSKLYGALFFDERREPTRTIIKRVCDKGHFADNAGVINELKTVEVVAILHCSHRKAREYRRVLQIMCL